MKKQLDKEQLNYVTGGALEDYNDFIKDALKAEEEKLRDATTHPDAKKEKGDYKKTR